MPSAVFFPLIFCPEWSTFSTVPLNQLIYLLIKRKTMMKAFLVAIFLIAVAFMGCSKNDPISANSGSASISQGEAAYSAISMYKTYVGSVAKIASETGTVADTGACPHDSLRNANMLDSIKVYLSLTDDQFTALKGLGDALFAQLKAIRAQELGAQISHDSAHVLIDQARAAFVTGVKAVLTADQLSLFDTWLSLYWDRGLPGGKGHGGKGPGFPPDSTKGGRGPAFPPDTTHGKGPGFPSDTTHGKGPGFPADTTHGKPGCPPDSGKGPGFPPDSTHVGGRPAGPGGNGHRGPGGH
jgi:hypothetical protein